jgi:NAD(P)-dependent dehydrogenase (short-subunit alcohol dehydrogenase family)
MSKLEGKTAVVTGATSGMGAAIAERFAAEGAAVVASGRNQERGRALVDAIEAAGGQARLVLGDVGLEETNQRLVETAQVEFGHLDILVHCAGDLGLGSITEMTPERWHSAIASNLHSTYYLLHYGIPVMQRSGGGSIVVIGSIAAYKGFPNHAAYCASKGALIPLIRQVAGDYGPEIRANIICPGPVDTPLIWASAEAFPDPESAVAEAARSTVMKRLGTPADVASTALFLASEESSWMTGAALTLDGGRTIL